MADQTRIYRLWRTSAILCGLGAVEFGYVAWARHVWWPLILTVLLILCAGYALRQARAARGTPR